ncbi:gp18 [Klebsiella pneumoniae]|uniref:Gp18 n=1 Tax=Klebsiella pneumoniae TaxID=573 RepID=A0A4P0Y622_KLEPN|nr:gp18 [Klebsiella pneumoniae]
MRFVSWRSMARRLVWMRFCISTAITSPILQPKSSQLTATWDKLPAKSIWWQGREYKAWPCVIEGIESSTTGSDAQPTLRVGNIDGKISALCLHYDDLALARVIIHDTQKQYLDAKNFPDGNASADPTQEKRRLFFIDVKHYEDDEKVEFTLSSPFALQGMMIPTRQLHAICTWCTPQSIPQR